MITVKVDGNDIGFSDPGVGTIGDVVGTVAQDLDTALRIINIRYNGEDITGRPERHLDQIHGGDFELTTARANELALETLESIGEFHEALVAELGRTCEEFRSGSFERANELMLRCIDGMHVLTKTTHSVSGLLQLPVERVDVGSMTLAELTGKISEVLNEMIGAQENHDGILLADLIEYELQAILEDWKAALGVLADESRAA